MNNISVCMATYNGANYIKEQIDSILIQLDKNDELIIVDDCSTDDTVSIIKSVKDERIKLFHNEENRKHVYTFGRSISLSKNELIFLCDQDDIWIDDRIKIMKEYFDKISSLVISSNFLLLDSNKNVHESKNPLKKNDSKKYFKNVIGIMFGKKDYFGCAMAFRKELKNIILPFPNYLESHDLYIAIAGNILKSNLHIEEKTVYRRLHDNNVTNPNRSLGKKIKTRFIFIKSFINIRKRIKTSNNTKYVTFQ